MIYALSALVIHRTGIVKGKEETRSVLELVVDQKGHKVQLSSTSSSRIKHNLVSAADQTKSQFSSCKHKRDKEIKIIGEKRERERGRERERERERDYY